MADTSSGGGTADERQRSNEESSLRHHAAEEAAEMIPPPPPSSSPEEVAAAAADDEEEGARREGANPSNRLEVSERSREVLEHQIERSDSILSSSTTASDEADELPQHDDLPPSRRRGPARGAFSASFVYMQEASMEASALLMEDDEGEEDNDLDDNTDDNKNAGSGRSGEGGGGGGGTPSTPSPSSPPPSKKSSSSPRLTRIHPSGNAGKRRPSSNNEEIFVVDHHGGDDDDGEDGGCCPATNGKQTDGTVQRTEEEENDDEEEAVSVSFAKAPQQGVPPSPSAAGGDVGSQEWHGDDDSKGGAGQHAAPALDGSGGGTAPAPAKAPAPIRPARPAAAAVPEESVPAREDPAPPPSPVKRPAQQQISRPTQRGVTEVLREHNLLPGDDHAVEESDDGGDHDARVLHRLFDGFCRPPLELDTVREVLKNCCCDEASSTTTTKERRRPQHLIHHPVVIACDPPPSSCCKVVALVTAGYENCDNSLPAILQLPSRFACAFVDLIVSLLTGGDESEKEKQGLYSAARFQCHGGWKAVLRKEKDHAERPALTVLQTLCEKAAAISSPLLEPLTGLLGLLCTAGVTPRTLRYLLTNCSSRPCFVRALRTATHTSDDVQDFFCLDGANCGDGGGLQRTLTGRQWPFRNDFCLATSFRAECFATSAAGTMPSGSFRPKPKKSATIMTVLMTCRASNGAGFEVRLVQPSPQQNCAVIEVCVYDSSPAAQRQHHRHEDQTTTPNRTLTVRQCVLLPRVWYHLAVRHTRSRLKGVFSLSTRQQVSVMLNGKVLLTESCAFPKVEGDDYSFYNSSILPKQRSSSSSNLMNLTVTVGMNYDGQIGPVYILDDNVSDASLRALYESSSQRKSNMLRRRTKSSSSVSGNPAGLIDDNTWDAHKSNILKKSRVLDVSITNDDAEEIVLSQRGMGKRGSFKAVPDAIGESDEDVDTPLQRSNFASKIFLAWDPQRVVDGSIIDIHIGAHVNKLDRVYSWNTNRVQDAISSVGGIQALVPVFRAVLADSNSGNSEQRSSLPHYDEAMSDLFLLLKSFVQDHDDNAREMLRCGGVDVIEQLIYSNRKGPLLRAIQAHGRLARLLVQSLLELRSSCSHYVGLETKVFSRLLFNIPLWLGASSSQDGENALQLELLPRLSSFTRSNPEKVRDCIGIKDMVSALKNYLEEFNAKNISVTADSLLKKQQVADILIGMIFEVLAAGTTSATFQYLLNFLTFHLESEWNEASQGLETCLTPYQQERHRITVSLSTALLFLLQTRPPGLFESFAHVCGGAHGGVAWILSGLVNAYDDKVRSLGVRCVAAYLLYFTSDFTNKGADVPLSFGAPLQPAESDMSLGADSHHSSVMRLGIMAAKGLAAMGPAGVRSIVTNPSKLTPRVVMKLLWHLLKSHRSRLGSLTQAALLYWISDDNGLVSNLISSSSHVQSHLITESKTEEPGFCFCAEWADAILSETGNIVGRSYRSPLALGVVLRLLRFLEGDMQGRWLSDLLALAKASRKSTSMLSSLPEWQPCLFHLISDTLELHISTSNPASNSDDVNKSEELDSSHVNGGTIGEEREAASSNTTTGAVSAVSLRLDRSLELYSTLLGHLFREGGDKALDAVEKAASLQRVCVNGHDVIFLVLSWLCANVFDFGTIMEIGSIPAQDFWKSVDIEQESLPLKQSARLVTDAILSNGTKGLDMTSAVRSWRSLRHLTEIIVSVVIKSGFGVVDLFDYINQQAYSIDAVSGGLNGLRLPDYRLPGIGSCDYLAYTQAAGGKRSAVQDGSDSENEFRRDVDRRLCAYIAAQILIILDAFIFPDSLDEALPASQLHGLALVRNSEPRLGSSQGPLVSSAIRLSLVLLALLEPCSVKLLQCASRMRCLLYWALELIREASTPDGKPKPFDEKVAPLDHMVVASVLQCHRALGRCAALQSEIESSSHDKYFESREAYKKHYRRLLRVALELRDVVYTVYRGRNEVLRASLSSESYEALRVSLEGNSSNSKSMSKEAVIRAFLASPWVSGFQDVETRMDLAVPEQLSMDTVPLSSDQPPATGFATIQMLSQESTAIISDFERALNGGFEDYLEEQRKWAETDLVRDCEFEGDSTLKKLSERYKLDAIEIARTIQLRRSGADNRARAIYRNAVEPWENASHWRLARYTDRLGRRTLLVQNRHFSEHADASYELMMEKEREKADKERQARLAENDLSDVMRRNVEAFTLKEATESTSDVEGSEDDSSVTHASDGESSTGVESVDPSFKEEAAVEESEHEEGWDKIDTEEIKDVDAEGADIDAWAKAFIWSDNESVVARFEHVMIISLQVYVEGMLLLTTHGLYFHQVGDEFSVMTKEPIDSADTAGSDTRDRRWRLSRLTEIHGRRYMLRHQALELFFSDSHELFLNFPGGNRERDRFHAKLRNSCKVPMLWSPKSLNPRTLFRKSKLTELWKKRKLSNFEYLMALNRMAGRSFNDITQYPVFPWILADYTSETIDLSDSRVYRDLSKPVGALNPDRLAQLLERYKDLELFGFTEAERFLYGSHYSSPGIVLHFLIRQEPFTTMAIELQSGRFDCPDRLFFDIASSWDGCLTSTSDMKELIPEFFSLPEMFLNTNKFPLGRTQSGRVVDNVGLPPWAKGSAYEFVRVHRLALESEFVSQNLHHWIDLIFGFKQRGPEAEAAHNIFHHLSYEGSVDLDKIADDVDRQAAESHIQNFGQTPSQLIVAEPHPSRYGSEECWKPLIYNSAVPQRLRSLTPAKQFGNKRSEHAKGAVVKIHVLSDQVLAVYADMSIGTYKWFPTSKTNRLRMDKLRPMSRRELSTSRAAIKRGSAIPQDKLEQSCRAVGNWSFAATIGGNAKEELRRKAVLTSGSRLIASSEITLASAETACSLISCGYWDDTVKAHSIESLRPVASETGGHRGTIRCLAVGQDGGLMVTGGQDCTCRVWVIEHPDMAIALSDGYVQTVLGASNDGGQVLSCCHVLWGHTSAVTCVGLDSDLDAVVSGSQSGDLCVHTIRRGEFVRSYRPPALVAGTSAGAVKKVALDTTGNMVVHMEDHGLHAYTVNAVRLSWTNAGEELYDMKICSGGEFLVTGGKRCQVLIRTVVDLNHVCSMLDLTKHGPIRCIALTPDDLNPTEQFLFIGSDDGMMTIVDEDPLKRQQQHSEKPSLTRV